MLLFGFLTIINVRESRRRVTARPGTKENTIAGRDSDNPVGTTTLSESTNRKNRQLFQMVLVQIAIFVLLTTIGTVTYLMVTFIPQPSVLLLFLFAIARLPFDTTFCISFYFYVLSASLYRQELMKLYRRIWQRLNIFIN